MMCRRLAALGLALIVVGARPAGAKVSWTTVLKPATGVEVRKGRTADNKNDVYAALASLCTSYIHVAATAPPTKLTTAGSWGAAAGVQVAVNGDFYQMANGLPSVYGDAVGGGKHWPTSQTGVDDSWHWAYLNHGWIAFGPGWAEFSHSELVKKSTTLGGQYGWYPGALTTAIPNGTQALVSGFSELVIEGQPYTCSSPTASTCFPDRSDMRARHPRTAMGLTQDRRTLILAVVDGRTTQSIGMYGTELAALMHELGAWVAFNLDGGGSSQIWVKGTGYFNKPSDGTARAVANHWGIYAGAASGKPQTPGSCFVAGGCYATRVEGALSSLFKDMPTAWFGYAEAALLHQKKITSGCKQSPDLMFCPRCPITRRQMVAFLVRAAGISTANPPATPTFSDVPASAADYALIEAAAAAGITKGCGGGKFCPNDPVTRGAAAAFTVRTTGWKLAAPASPSFADVPASHLFYKEIETLKSRCVTSGCGGGKFCPDQTLNRASAAVWVVRAFNLDGKNGCLAPPATDGGPPAPAVDAAPPPEPLDGGALPPPGWDMGAGDGMAPTADGGLPPVPNDTGSGLTEGEGCSCAVLRHPTTAPVWHVGLFLLLLLWRRSRSG